MYSLLSICPLWPELWSETRTHLKWRWRLITSGPSSHIISLADAYAGVRLCVVRPGHGLPARLPDVSLDSICLRVVGSPQQAEDPPTYCSPSQLHATQYSATLALCLYRDRNSSRFFNWLTIATKWRTLSILACISIYQVESLSKWVEKGS